MSSFGPKVPCLFILMERANGGNLEEYVQLQWNPEEQLEKALSVKERIKRKRLRMKEAQNQIKDNRAQFFGGIGYDSFGKRVRYLTSEAIWKIFLDICYGLNHLHEVKKIIHYIYITIIIIIIIIIIINDIYYCYYFYIDLYKIINFYNIKYDYKFVSLLKYLN